MKWKMTLATVVFGVVIRINVPADASVLFQSVPDLNGPIYPSGICSACFGEFRAFDTFSLNSDAVIDAVTVSVYPVPFPVNVGLSIWSLNGGLPDSELFSETFTPSEFASVSHPDGYRALVTLDPVGLTLVSGFYDISFYDADGLALDTYYGGSGLLYQQDHGAVQGASLGFILSGDATPIPSTLPLFASGLVSLALFGRKWQRKSLSAVPSKI